MQLGREAIFVTGNCCCREAFAQLCDFFGAGSAAANFRTTAGCGHSILLWPSVGSSSLPRDENHESELRSKLKSSQARAKLNYRVPRRHWQRQSQIPEEQRIQPSSVELRWRLTRSRPIAAAHQYRKARIFCKPRVFERKFAHQKSGTAIGFNPARVSTVSAEPCITMDRCVVYHGRTAHSLYRPYAWRLLLTSQMPSNPKLIDHQRCVL